MDAFFGSWTLVTKENANEYMEALDGDYIVKKIKMFEAINRTFTLTFKLGEEFDESTIDFRVCKSVLNLEGGKLIHLQKWDGKENTTIYEVQDEKLIITLIFRDIVSVWTFVKIK
ncbi:fatty acid-binding protein, brain-like isoform X3 [Hemibagrus wyckioides]|uniref:fatty acid-binding protein, brain-like isoform X3 n=1 Tax=Hemibagrus wyckioides TaxID=337641 RepID=UPI00266C1BA1|nr:fatty acid-binding protein, brain-like isoform X3 [Hemibagrus wyckioides]